jgi:hypothetical protein
MFFCPVTPFLNPWCIPGTPAAFGLDWLLEAQRCQRDAFRMWLDFLQSCTPDFRPAVEVLPPLASLPVEERQAMVFLKRV